MTLLQLGEGSEQGGVILVGPRLCGIEKEVLSTMQGRSEILRSHPQMGNVHAVRVDAEMMHDAPFRELAKRQNGVSTTGRAVIGNRPIAPFRSREQLRQIPVLHVMQGHHGALTGARKGDWDREGVVDH
jgi:hypothetical protein